MSILKKIREAKNDAQKNFSEPSKPTKALPAWDETDDAYPTTFEEPNNSKSQPSQPTPPRKPLDLATPDGPCPTCGCNMFWITVYDPRGKSPRCRGCEPPPADALILMKIELLDDPIEWFYGWCNPVAFFPF